MDTVIQEIWQQFSARLLSYIKTKVSDTHMAEDILQEVFVKLYLNVDSLKDPNHLSPWLYKITRNTIIDYYRKKKESPLNIEAIEKDLPLENNFGNMNNDMIDCLNLMLKELPEKYQEAIVLYDLKAMKHKDISEKLNLTVSGSKTRVERARFKLRALLNTCCSFEVDAYGNVLDIQSKGSKSCNAPHCKL